MRIVFLSHSPYSSVLRVGSHHLAREFAMQGHRVLHLSSPRTPLHAARSVIERHWSTIRLKPTLMTHPEGDVHAVSVQALPDELAWRAGIARSLLPASLRRIVERGGFTRPDIVFVDQPTLAGRAVALAPDVLIYRPTDRHHRPGQLRAEAFLLRMMDGIVATSEDVLNSVAGSRHGKPATILPNGVEYRRFSEARPRGRDVAYLGAIDYRFDIAGLVELAIATPDRRFLLAGPVTIPIGQLPGNVELVGEVPYEEAPQFLSSARVGILPLNAASINKGRSPMKLFEYAAAGLHVLASDSPTLRDVSFPGLHVYQSPDEAAVRLRQIPDQENKEGRLAAAQRDWGASARTLLDFATTIRHQK